MRLFLFVLCFVSGLTLSAQQSPIRNPEFYATVGVAELDIETFPVRENLDFMNYFDSYPEYLDYIIAKLGVQFDFLEKMSADIRIILMDDLIPDNFNFSVCYHLNKHLGIGAGAMLHKDYITSFGDFHRETMTDYYLTDNNLRQFEAYDLGYYITPVVRPFVTESFRITFRCELGLSSFLKESATFYLKRKRANERRIYNYQTRLGFQPYVKPVLSLKCNVYKGNKASFGLMLSAGLYRSKKSINYDRSIQIWTPGNRTTETIKPPKHRYSRYETDIGCYLTW